MDDSGGCPRTASESRVQENTFNRPLDPTLNSQNFTIDQPRMETLASLFLTTI